MDGLKDRFVQRFEDLNRYVDAYGNYCWPIESLADLKLAPFHIMATEGAVHVDRDHAWHMERLAHLASFGEPILMATANVEVDLLDEQSQAAAIAWWEALTGQGGEGMVVKSKSFIGKGRRAWLSRRSNAVAVSICESSMDRTTRSPRTLRACGTGLLVGSGP